MSEIDRSEAPSEAAARATRSRPAMAIWGAVDRTLHAEHFLPLFTALFPRAPLHLLDGVGHHSPEDAPDTIAALIDTFARLT